MKIACNTVLFRQHPLEKALTAIRGIGYEYVETQSVGPWCPHVDVQRDDPVKYADLVRSYGFKGTTALWMRNGQLISNKDALEWAILTIEWAKAAGIPVVNTGDGFKPENMRDDEAFAVYEERIMKILETCERTKTIIAIEPHGTFSLTGDGLVRLMQVSDSPWLGINYDACNIHRASYVENRDGLTGYVHQSGGEDEVEVLRRVIGRVKHVHAKDLIDNHCTALGEGEVKIAQCLEVLRASTYDGAVSLETEGDEPFEVSRDIAEKSHAFLTEWVG